MTRSIMMLAALIGQMAGEQAWIGEATWTVGTAAVSRGDQNYALQASSGILDGDVLRMPAGAAAGVDLRQQRHVMLAPLTEVVIRNQGAAASLNVAYGEVRGVSAGPLEIQTAQAKVALNSGIVRAKVGPTGTAVWCESGKATIVYDVADRPASGVRSVAARLAQETLVLGAGEAVLIPATGSGAQSIDPGSEAWANFQSLQLRGAAAASRSSKGQYIAGSANSDRSQFQQQMANNQQQQSQQQQSQQEATTTQPAEEPNQDTETTSQTDIAVALGPSLQLAGTAFGSGPAIPGSGGAGADATQRLPAFGFNTSAETVTVTRYMELDSDNNGSIDTIVNDGTADVTLAGNIFAVTADRGVVVSGVGLEQNEMNGSDYQYFSISNSGTEFIPVQDRLDGSEQVISGRENARAIAIPNASQFVVAWGDISNDDPLMRPSPGDVDFDAANAGNGFPDSLLGRIGNLGTTYDDNGNLLPPGEITEAQRVEVNDNFVPLANVIPSGNDSFGFLDTKGGVKDTGSINQKLTYFFGQFFFGRNSDGSLTITSRVSDQDREFVYQVPPDPNGGTGIDINSNPSVEYAQRVDEFGSPVVDEVFPHSYSRTPVNLQTFIQSNRAAFTIMTGEALHGFARRTGQTRFVIDGQLIDITGYRPQP